MQQNPGSPPRMRGKVSGQRRFYGKAGITPAYAGKSVSLNVLTPVFRDHPRVCGEKPTVPAVGTVFAGSPPRMRGKDFSHLGDVGQNRITPAYAGKSFATHWTNSRIRDHPRVCGEKKGCKQP